MRPLAPPTRAFLVAYGLLALALGASGYLLSADTDRFFPWTIEPPLTAAQLGALYLAAATTAAVCLRRTAWADGRTLVPAILIAGITLLVPTLIHLDRFHMDSPTGWIWLAAYVAVTPLLAAVTVHQLREPGADPPRRAPMPVAVRGLLAGQGAVLVAVGATLLIAPSTRSIWPWELTPLTAQAIGGWLLPHGVFILQAAAEADWRRTRPAMANLALLGALTALAVARYPGTVEWSEPSAWIYALVVASVGAAGLAGLRAAGRVA